MKSRIRCPRCDCGFDAKVPGRVTVPSMANLITAFSLSIIVACAYLLLAVGG